jgi:hypothetical protein
MKTSRWILCLALALPSLCHGQGTGFSYQGRLLDNGEPATGIYDIQMVLMDSPLNGNQLGPSFMSFSTAISNGLLNVTLDFGDNVFTGAARWLEARIRTNGSSVFTPLSPRQRLTQTPYATWARTADIASNLQGNGAGLTNLNGAAIAIGTITSNQIDSATWQLATATPSNLVHVGRGMITPYDCGAVGDGSADDTLALQTFLNNATRSNLIAFLPPAKGPWYKITDTLRVTNQNGLKLIGAGGQIHVTGIFPWSKAHIRQFGAGKSGLVIEDDALGQITDSVHIEGIMISADGTYNWTNSNCFGIGFDGNAGNTDCDVIQACGIFGFGVGLQLTSASDLSVISCSFGFNRDGVYCGGSVAHPMPVLNSIKLQTCQLSYNYSNQVRLTEGFLTLDTCDIASVSANSRGILIERGNAYVFNCNFEHHGTFEPAIKAVSADRSAQLVLDHGRVLNFGSGKPYSIVATNAAVYLYNPGLGSVDGNGVAVFLVNTLDSEAHAYLSQPGTRIRLMGPSGEQSTNSWGHFMRMVTHGPPSDLREPGSLIVGQKTQGFEQSDLWFVARMAAYGGTGGPEAVSLIQYQKDKVTTANFNTVTATNGYRLGAVIWTTGSGSPEGVVSAPIGSLYSRTNGGPGSSLFVKESGVGSFGWVGK